MLSLIPRKTKPLHGAVWCSSEGSSADAYARGFLSEMINSRSRAPPTAQIQGWTDRFSECKSLLTPASLHRGEGLCSFSLSGGRLG